MHSFHAYMRLGLVHAMAYPQTMRGESVVDTIRRVAMDSDFSVIELAWIKDGDVLSQVKEIVDTAGIAVTTAGQPSLLASGLNINDLDEEGRLRAVALMKQGIDQADYLGAECFSFLGGRYEQKSIEQSYGQLVKSTNELCAYAADKGNMNIVLEVFDHNVDKKSIIGPVSIAKRYAEEIKSRCSNFGLMVDLSHLPLLGETAREAIMPVRDYIVQAHVGNCVLDPLLPLYGDMHPRFGFFGSCNGVPELADYLAILLECGFLNKAKPPIVSFEVKPYKNEEPDLVIANARRTLIRAWSMLETR